VHPLNEAVTIPEGEEVEEAKIEAKTVPVTTKVLTTGNFQVLLETMQILFKIKSLCKDCNDRIAQGHAIPLADIEEGLYNKDYFSIPTDSETHNLEPSHQQPPFHPHPLKSPYIAH
jgi:hypothetical protein